MTFVLLVGSALAIPTASKLQSHWATYLETSATHALVASPQISNEEWQELAAGEVVKQRFRAPTESIDRLVAIAFIDQPVESFWIAVLDDRHNELVEDLRDIRLPGTRPGHKILYQHLQVPFPFTDRHWILRIESNAKLYHASGGRAWERIWRLDERGPAALNTLPDQWKDNLGNFIWTPVNNGSWLLLRIGFSTLVVYQVQTDIGGWIPEGLFLAYVKAKLDDMIEHLSGVADEVPGHYADDHEPIYGPDGAALPTSNRDTQHSAN